MEYGQSHKDRKQRAVARVGERRGSCLIVQSFSFRRWRIWGWIYNNGKVCHNHWTVHLRSLKWQHFMLCVLFHKEMEEGMERDILAKAILRKKVIQVHVSRFKPTHICLDVPGVRKERILSDLVQVGFAPQTPWTGVTTGLVLSYGRVREARCELQQRSTCFGVIWIRPYLPFSWASCHPLQGKGNQSSWSSETLVWCTTDKKLTLV